MIDLLELCYDVREIIKVLSIFGSLKRFYSFINSTYICILKNLIMKKILFNTINP